VSGKLKDLDLYNSESLKKKLNYFLDNVKKRIYLTGPKNLLEIEKVLGNDCKFKGNKTDFERKDSFKNFTNKKAEIVFVPVPDANQVQVRIGRFLNSSEIKDRNLDILATDLLGGGFTSKLMREVRVKRGLTYSIGSYISAQKEYGRAGITTYTKNETLNKLIEVIQTTLENVKKSGVTVDELERGRSGLLGSHPFKFESNRAFLLQLLYLDHIGVDYDELFNFNEIIKKYSITDVNQKLNSVYDPKLQTIFILGDKSLEKEIKKLPKKYGKIIKRDYKDFI
jgi:zinc protease